EKGGRRKRMKPPGIPFLSLDGKIIVPDKLPIDKKASFIPGEKPEEEMLEIETSRRLIKEMDMKKERVEEEKTSPVFDELLQFQAESENKADDAQVQLDRDQSDIEDVSSLSVGFSELEMRGDDMEEKKQEIELSPVPEENKESKGENVFGDSEFDEGFDEFIVDMDHVEDQEISDSTEIADFENILEIEEQGISEVEDKITTSIAGELLGEEIGEKKDQGEKKVSDYYQHEEAFLEMMEGVGFDRRTVLSGDREGQKKKGPEARSDLSKKRFLESGLWFYRQGLFAKAINELKKAIKEDPAYVEAHQCLGDTFFRLGEFDSAKNAYEKVKKLDPNNENVLENLGVIFANSGDYKRAVWQWGEVLKNNPDRKDIVDRIKKIQRVIRQRCL
ncbi:tetratricopeptide repeat protein, partial [bacterium]|nr:tetratricopeptide repeat protein [bacterium]